MKWFIKETIDQKKIKKGDSLQTIAWSSGDGSVDVNAAKLAHIGQAIQLGTAVVLVPILFLLCAKLHSQAGWENGPVEMAQNCLLGFAAVASLLMAVVRRAYEQKYFWIGVTLIWLILLGRELSWGAVLLSVLDFSEITGPRFSSQKLWYRPYVVTVVVFVLALALFFIALAQPLPMLKYAWNRRSLIPYGALLSILLYGLLATLAESNISSMKMLFPQPQVAEEVFETGAYYFLFRSQLAAFLAWLKPVVEKTGSPTTSP